MSRDDNAIRRIEIGEKLERARQILAAYREHTDYYLREVEDYQHELGRLDERLGE